MKRKRRTRILIEGSSCLAERLSDEIAEKYIVKTIEEPNSGLVMIKMRETAKNSLFYLGEVLVTEAKVQLCNCLGIGIVQGTNEKLAYQLAVIDAAYNSGLKETEEWMQMLLEEEAEIEKKTDNHNAKVMQTRVSFETMDV